MTVPAGSLMVALCGGVTDSPGPGFLAATIMAIITSPGTPSVWNFFSVSGEVSKLQSDDLILAMISSTGRSALSIARTSWLLSAVLELCDCWMVFAAVACPPGSTAVRTANSSARNNNGENLCLIGSPPDAVQPSTTDMAIGVPL